MAYYVMAQDGGTFAAFDSIISETHSETCMVTAHNVETGAPITDHVKPDPSLLSLVLVVTNTPIESDPDQGRGGPTVVDLYTPTYAPPFDGTPGALFREAAGFLSGPRPQTTKVEVFAQPSPIDRIAETEAALIVLKATGRQCQVVTLSRVYQDMVIVRWELARTGPGSAQFSLDLQQIRTVSTATTAAPQPVEPKGAPKRNMGAQTPKTPQDNETLLSKTELKAIVDKFTGLLGGG